MRRFTLAVALAAALAALAVPAAATDNQNNWHIHDGGSGDGHYPRLSSTILTGETATCPNATDKSLLPSGHQANAPLRAGVCFTSTKVIHLRTIADDGAPMGGGWALLPGTGPWYTYYLITDR